MRVKCTVFFPSSAATTGLVSVQQKPFGTSSPCSLLPAQGRHSCTSKTNKCVRRQLYCLTHGSTSLAARAPPPLPLLHAEVKGLVQYTRSSTTRHISTVTERSPRLPSGRDHVIVLQYPFRPLNLKSTSASAPWDCDGSMFSTPTPPPPPQLTSFLVREARAHHVFPLAPTACLEPITFCAPLPSPASKLGLFFTTPLALTPAWSA